MVQSRQSHGDDIDKSLFRCNKNYCNLRCWVGSIFEIEIGFF